MRSSGWSLLGLAASLACAPAAQGPRRPAPRSPVEELRTALDSLTGDTKFARAQLGIMVVNPVSGDTLYSLHPDKLFTPASNQKIVTAAVALSQLGPEFRFRTLVAARGVRRDSVLDGDLVIVGRGDPTLSDRMRGSAMSAMLTVADSIAARGIRRITGMLRPGGNAFPDSIYGYGWEWDDLRGRFAAPFDELLYDEGSYLSPRRINGRDTTIRVATRNPRLQYLNALDTALRRRGVTAAGVSDSSADLTLLRDTLFIFWSPPLRELLKHFMKPSQNQIGEVLLRTLGLERGGEGSADSGSVVVARQLAAWGIPSTDFVAYDGSGMSRHDLVTPRTIIRILSAIQKDTAFAAFYESLPIAGVDGTLRNRMKETPAANVVRAKTGDLEFVRSLSGYATTASGERLIFAMLSNNFTGQSSEIARLMDAISVRLATYRSARPQ